MKLNEFFRVLLMSSVVTWIILTHTWIYKLAKGTKYEIPASGILYGVLVAFILGVSVYRSCNLK